MTRWAFCKFRFTPTMPVCVIWLLKTKYFYSILFHFSVPMKNIQHNSNGSWMFFRLNVKWRKLQGKSEDRIMKYSRMIAVCMLWPWTDGLQSLVSYSEWRGISMAASSTSTSPLPMNSWFYTGLQTVPASGRDWRCQWGKSGLVCDCVWM